MEYGVKSWGYRIDQQVDVEGKELIVAPARSKTTIRRWMLEFCEGDIVVLAVDE